MSRAQALFSEWLAEVGLSAEPEAADTPRRFTELLRSYAPADLPDVSTFPVASPGPVVLRDLPFHSLCAHHLLPFFGTITVAYLPDERVGGLSGLARLVAARAQRLQLQERLTGEIADDLMGVLRPHSVLVRCQARQMCMEMRGAKSAGTIESWAERGDVAPLRGLV